MYVAALCPIKHLLVYYAHAICWFIDEVSVVWMFETMKLLMRKLACKRQCLMLFFFFVVNNKTQFVLHIFLSESFNKKSRFVIGYKFAHFYLKNFFLQNFIQHFIKTFNMLFAGTSKTALHWTRFNPFQ